MADELTPEQIQAIEIAKGRAAAFASGALSDKPAAPPPPGPMQAASVPGGSALDTLSDATTGVGEAIPFKNELFAGIAAPFRAGYGYATGGDSSLGDAYNAELAKLHKIDTDANARSPVATTLGQVAGMALAGPETGGARSLTDFAANQALAKGNAAENAIENLTPAGRFQRMWDAVRGGTGSTLKAGAGNAAYGGALGVSNAMDEGGDLNDIESKGLWGAGIGGAAGAAGVPLGAAAGAVGDYGVAPMIRTLRNTGKQAGINIASYLGRDAAGMAGKAIPDRGLTPQELDALRSGGFYPVANVHLGGSNVASMARSAADTSPDALETMVNGTATSPGLKGIQQGQLGRYASVIDSYLPEEGALASREAALTDGRNQVRPLYDAAYANPNAHGMYNEGFEQLMQSPIFQGAMKGALKTSQDEAALAGTNVVLPKFAYRDMGDGTKRLIWAPQEGNPTPSLPFWNEVKKNLDDVIDNNTAITGKGNNTANLAYRLKTNMLNYLDMMVPEYKAARAAAGRYLGENNAFDAGTKLYSQANGPKLNLDDAERMINSWTPEERQAAGNAYLDALKNDLFSKSRAVTGDAGTADLSNNFLKSQKAREVGHMLLGRDVMNGLEAHNSIERLMASRFNAVTGNSKTNRFQLSRELMAPVAGAAGENYLLGDGSFNPLHLSSGAALGLLLRHGKAGLNTALQKRLAPEIAKRLMENDSSAYVPAIRQLATDPTMMGWMRLLAGTGAGAAAQYGAQ